MAMDPKLKVQLDKLHAALVKEKLERSLVNWEKLVAKPASEITDPDHLAKVIEQFSDANILKIIETEKREAKIDLALPQFNFDEILIDWLKTVPFFLEMSRWVRKRPSTTMRGGSPNPTAAMCFNLETEDFEMLYNPRWFTSLKIFNDDGVKQIEGVINHELYHMLWKHITTRRRDPMFAWNIATDAGINSIITNNNGKLPKGGIIPGQKWDVPECRNMTPEETKMHEGLAKLIESWPAKMSSDWYFENLMKWSEDNNYEWGKRGIKLKGQSGGKIKLGIGDGDEEGEFEIEGVDEHGMWDDIPEEKRILIEEKLKGIVRKAVKHADNTQNGWGNIPSELKELIKASVDDQIDWEAVLKNFIGMFSRGSRATSLKKINKRYPYIHAGVKKGYMPHIAIGMDQSGSVSDKSVEMFFGVLGSLAKKVSFTIIPFDASVDKGNIVEWKRGQKPELKRTRCGGTSFECITEYVNATENRGKWDGLIILTDGECNDPGPSRVKRGWVICPDHKLMFDTDEIVMNMDDPEKRVKTKGVVR